MKELALSVGEPFTSPAWGGNFVMFSTENGQPISEAYAKDYIGRCCKYARHYKVWLIPERFILLDYHSMCLINPEGKVIGAQKALFNGPGHRSGKKSATMEVYPTDFGTVCLCVDVDIYRPEVSRIASAMGAQIIFCNQNILQGDYGSHMVLSGAWNAAQLAGVYVVAVTNQFNCVCLPLSLSPLGDGFLNAPSFKLPMTQRIKAEKLDSLPRPRPLTRKLYALHRNELSEKWS